MEAFLGQVMRAERKWKRKVSAAVAVYHFGTAAAFRAAMII